MKIFSNKKPGFSKCIFTVKENHNGNKNEYLFNRGENFLCLLGNADVFFRVRANKSVGFAG
ncbi:Uncharacterized protein dnm_019410 [Desulfonema magnum]|uniref:Uncharacterized protein n=1 Tax=Desulfonema magnum TaxID=45655 RepID=A0A975BHN9_9BACT|nr:Uncharacterized protein dnm_019410 [Desulfonema magnum]